MTPMQIESPSRLSEMTRRRRASVPQPARMPPARRGASPVVGKAVPWRPRQPAALCSSPGPGAGERGSAATTARCAGRRPCRRRSRPTSPVPGSQPPVQGLTDQQRLRPSLFQRRGRGPQARPSIDVPLPAPQGIPAVFDRQAGTSHVQKPGREHGLGHVVPGRRGFFLLRLARPALPALRQGSPLALQPPIIVAPWGTESGKKWLR